MRSGSSSPGRPSGRRGRWRSRPARCPLLRSSPRPGPASPSGREYSLDLVQGPARRVSVKLGVVDGLLGFLHLLSGRFELRLLALELLLGGGELALGLLAALGLLLAGAAL